MKKGAKILEGNHDFSTFRASSCGARSPIKNMKSINVTKRGDKIFIIFNPNLSSESSKINGRLPKIFINL